MGISYLAVALAVFVAFLGILAGLSVAVTKTVNPDGRVSRGFFGGLASAIALVFLGWNRLRGRTPVDGEGEPVGLTSHGFRVAASVVVAGFAFFWFFQRAGWI